MKVEDEYGVQYKVTGGDPANKLVLALKKRRFDYVVLPRETLITGELTDDVPFVTDVIRDARLDECLAVLKEVV